MDIIPKGFKVTYGVNLLRDSLEFAVGYYDTFENNFEIQNDFTKYLKESCWHYSE